jgi:opacity protein-like surface antigen
VVGIEGDYSYLNLSNRSRLSYTDAFGNAAYQANGAVRSQIGSYGTVRGRVGYLVTPDLLVYGTGGVAFADVSTRASVSEGISFGNPATYAGLATYSGRNSGVKVGYAYGGGAEYKIDPSWSVKVEALRVQLPESRVFAGNDTGFGYAVRRVKNDFTVVRAGLNYSFQSRFGALSRRGPLLPCAARQTPRRTNPHDPGPRQPSPSRRRRPRGQFAPRSPRAVPRRRRPDRVHRPGPCPDRAARSGRTGAGARVDPVTRSYPQTIRWIGDIHGDASLRIYADLIATTLPTRQIGDLGLNYGSPPPLCDKDRWIRGNHDDPAWARGHPNWIPDGTVEDGILYVGGAQSRDRTRRVEGQSWWRDEELDIPAWNAVIARHDAHRPRVVASHDLPESIRDHLFARGYDDPPTRTRQALQTMLEIHAPAAWIFGHWHESRDAVIGGVRFIGLGLHEARDLAL